MQDRTPLRSHVCALLGYAAVAIVFAWPLPLHLGTHFTGAVTGDTGVYVWNQWVFQHEILDHRGLPYFTDRIFATSNRANLSLHNYTTFQNLIALPLIRPLGIVTAFNLVYLFMTVLTAYTTFLLAKHVTGRVAESWLAGFMFGWSPILVTRGMGHFSLVAAAPLAVFLLLLVRTELRERERLRDAIALGATVWWAASSDAYYAVYCLLIALVFLSARMISVERNPSVARTRMVRWALEVLILCVAGLIIAMIASRGWAFTFLQRPIRMRSLYTPMLVLTALVVIRVAWHYRTSITKVTSADLWRVARLAVKTGVIASILLAPVLYAAAVRISEGSFESSRVYWRSSPRGVDLLAFLLPNPNHPFVPDAIGNWLTSKRDVYLESVASIPLVGLAVVITALVRGWRSSRWWATMTICFGLLALGPFIYVAGENTFVPGPWALLRYVPIIGLARAPGRFTVVMTLSFAMVFAAALAWIGHRLPKGRRNVLLVCVGMLLAFELLPAPRPLYSAAVPSIYRIIAAEPADVRVLELPFGVRDGTSSAGNFTARTQYFQTAHGKPILGGYLSRVLRRRVLEVRGDDVLGGLVRLSEDKQLTPEQERCLLEQGPSFAKRHQLGFVVIERGRVSEALTGLAIRAFRLRHVASDGNFELYRPQVD